MNYLLLQAIETSIAKCNTSRETPCSWKKIKENHKIKLK
jgi:hypothetical protein